MNNEIELKSLCGGHVLTGVDRLPIKGEEIRGCEDSQVLNFTLDGKTYTACEDPQDGYRSRMKYLRVSESPTVNTFPPVKVVGNMRKGSDYYSENDVLELRDFYTGDVVLAVGTANIDDYYPYWVGEFSPEKMSVNRERE